jgi:oligopeptide/dipeptide ABC transporter ATP-binding protein
MMGRFYEVDMLEQVGIDNGSRRLEQYPHELSGGMLQRVMIASALLTEPRLLLADEPTTALDVTTQAEVMAIIDEFRRDRELALLFITHDLELASAVCDRTAVLYAGQVMETRASTPLHDDPLHPYTAGLVAARPSIEQTSARLSAIPGRPVSAFEAPDGCPFATRCEYAQDRCTAGRPPVTRIHGGDVRCFRAGELHGQLAVSVV